MRILFIQDPNSQAQNFCQSFAEYGFEIIPVATSEAELYLRAKTSFDVILLEILHLRDGFELQNFKKIQTLSTDIPIVILGENYSIDGALDFVKAGAQDFLVRNLVNNEDVVRALQFAFQRNQVEVALRRSGEHLRVIVENSYDAFMSMDSQRLITDWNIQAEKTFGWSRSEALGQSLVFLIPQHLRRRYMRDIENFFRNYDGKILKVSKELIAVHKDGLEFPIELTIFRVKESSNEIFFSFVRDITLQKSSSEALENLIQERTKNLEHSNKELHQFAKITAHDLQEPLRTIQGFANLLVESTKHSLNEDGKEFIHYILDGVTRMQSLIQSVLLHSQIPSEPDLTQHTNCSTVIDEVIENLRTLLLETSANIEVGKLPEVAVERTQLIQLFQNLIINSIKYRSEEPPEINIRAEASANEWLFSISDNGIGIDSKYAGKIFDMFSHLNGKAQYPGTGIGLAICKKIVDSHGGHIWVDSKLGKGSIFLFTLPSIKKKRNTKMNSNLNILLVEDTPSDVRLTQEALKSINFKSTLCVKNDGVEALEYLRDLKTSVDEKFPDVILLDLNMPRMNGHEVLEQIFQDETLRRIPVILLTVSERDEDIMEALGSKMNYYIAKPVTGEKLATLLKSIYSLENENSRSFPAQSTEEHHIRLVLAGNPHTSVMALKKLSEDASEKVRCRTAENPNLSASLFKILASDSSSEVRSSLAENPNIPDDILAILARDPSADVRLVISANTSLSAHLLQELSQDENTFVATSAHRTLETVSTNQK